MTSRTDSQAWVSLRAVARILGVSVKTAAKVIRAGKIRSRHLQGVKDRQYARVDALRLAETSESTAA
jgi:predicted site-specific integrase-resolvase